MTAVLLDQVAAYAAQVRAHLADLHPEQVEDLTDGLEADLTEALEDPAHPATGEIPLVLRDASVPGQAVPDGATSISALTERFGEPQAYAEELRAAAGLPAPRSHGGAGGPHPSVVDRLMLRLRADGDRLIAQPWWPAVPATGEALRPLWWVLRGWVLFNVVVTMVSGAEDVFFVPGNIFGVVLLLATIGASIQYGQGRWTLKGHGRHVLTGLNLVAAVGLLPVLGTAVAHAPTVQYVTSYEEESIADGVYLGGEPVTNLFVYGADGTFIDQAQIIDDKGRGVRVDRSGGVWDAHSDTSRYWSPAEDTYGRAVWNAFPLRMWSSEDGEWDGDGWSLPEGKLPTAVPPPFAQLAPVAPAPSATPAPTDPSTVPTDPAVPVDPSGPSVDGPVDGASDAPADGAAPDGATADAGAADDSTSGAGKAGSGLG